jgi:hypothetical protein
LRKVANALENLLHLVATAEKKKICIVIVYFPKREHRGEIYLQKSYVFQRSHVMKYFLEHIFVFLHNEIGIQFKILRKNIKKLTLKFLHVTHLTYHRMELRLPQKQYCTENLRKE